MTIPCDLHMHTSFSSDSDTPMEDMIRRAAQLGVRTVCFTEHMDYDYPPDPEGLTFLVDMPAYEAAIRRYRTLLPDSVEVLFGMEMGMQPHLAARYQELAQTHDFDYLIASQHLVGGLDPYARSFWEGRSEPEVYRQYFEELYANLLKMGDCFDTAAHLDYIVRYGPHQNRFYNYASYGDVIDPILELLIRRGKCLEVNTAGLKYGLGQTNPSSEVLRRYRELGGRLITIGSDAHEPAHMAWEFSRAARMLQELGFESVCIFRKRKPAEVPLADFL